MTKYNTLAALSAIQTLMARWELTEIEDVVCLHAIQHVLQVFESLKESDDAQKP